MIQLFTVNLRYPFGIFAASAFTILFTVSFYSASQTLRACTDQREKGDVHQHLQPLPEAVSGSQFFQGIHNQSCHKETGGLLFK